MTLIKRETIRPFRKVRNDLSGFSETEKIVYRREQGRLRKKKLDEKVKQERDRIRPFRKVRNDLSGFSETEKLAYIREQGRFRKKKLDEKAKQARKDMTPSELRNLKDKWSANSRKAHKKELHGRLPNATESERLYAQKKKEYRRNKQKELYYSTIQRRLKAVLRSRLRSALRNNQKAGSAIEDLGCSIDLLKTHLERNFLAGMTWENFGNKDGCWCIDHIYPISKADLTDKIELKAVCNWKNLMPLWHTDNVKKKDALTTESKRLFEMLCRIVS